MDAGAKMLADPDWYKQQAQQIRALANHASSYFSDAGAAPFPLPPSPSPAPLNNGGRHTEGERDEDACRQVVLSYRSAFRGREGERDEDACRQVVLSCHTITSIHTPLPPTLAPLYSHARCDARACCLPRRGRRCCTTAVLTNKQSSDASYARYSPSLVSRHVEAA